MKELFTKRYETQLENINAALGKKGGTKKLDKVWERIGKLKEKYPAANKYYNIEVKTDEGCKNATEIKWINPTCSFYPLKTTKYPQNNKISTNFTVFKNLYS